MAETARLGLPLLEAAQAQKHVTVNEALLRLDAGTAVTVTSVGLDTPPAAEEGAVHVVGTAPTGDWAGQAGALAFAIGGGWSFVAPGPGRRVTEAATGRHHVHDGIGWREGLVAGSSAGACTTMRVVTHDETLGSGAVQVTGALLPANTLVIGVSARVSEALGGATTWRLGVAGFDDRYGAGLGVAAGSHALGLTGAPLAYYVDTPLVMTSEDAPFSGGRATIAIHLIEIFPPLAF